MKTITLLCLSAFALLGQPGRMPQPVGCTPRAGVWRVLITPPDLLPRCASLTGNFTVNMADPNNPIIIINPDTVAMMNEALEEFNLSGVVLSATSTFTVTLARTPFPGTVVFMILRTPWGDGIGMMAVPVTNPKTLVIVLEVPLMAGSTILTTFPTGTKLITRIQTVE